MAIWNPHLISTKLCRVLDAGYATVDELAQAAGLPAWLIEKAATNSGLKLDAETKHRIGKALSPYFHAHPELYRDPERPEKRGVFEVQMSCGCFRRFEIRNAAGKKLRAVEIPSAECDQEAIDALWRWLDRREPMLRAI